MVVQLQWVVPGRVLSIRLAGNLSLSLLEHGFARLQRLQHTSPALHLIIDLRQVTRYPANVPRAQQAGIAYFQEAHGQRTLFLMTNWLHRYTFSVLWWEYRQNWQIFDTPPPALRFLKSVDTTLPDMSLPD